MTVVRLVVLAAALAAIPSAALAQDHWAKHWEATHGLDVLRGKTTEQLLAEVEWLRMNRPRDPAGSARYVQEFAELLDRALNNLRRVAAERGVRVPGDFNASAGLGEAGTRGAGAGSGGGGGSRAGNNTLKVEGGGTGEGRNDTRPIRKPGDPVVNSGLVLPLTVVLTAAQMAECTLRGVPVTDCAVDVGLRSAGGLAVGSTLVVLSTNGTPIVAALATGASLGLAGVATAGAVITTVYAGVEGLAATGAALGASDAERLLREQQAKNVARMNPGTLAALRDSFATTAGHVERAIAAVAPAARIPSTSRQDLDALVTQARSLAQEHRAFSETAKLAVSACTAPEQNPIQYASDLERRVQAAGRLAQSIDSGLARARGAVVPCAGSENARTAQRLQETAAAEAETLSSTTADAHADIRDAAAFFAKVKAGREAVTAAGRKLGELEQVLQSARVIATRLPGEASAYRTVRDEAHIQRTRLLASVEALKGAFGPDAGSGINGTIAAITALVPPEPEVIDNDELRRIAEAADTEVNRILGFLRSARETRVDVSACEGIADVMPSELRALLVRLGEELAAHNRLAAAATAAARDLAALTTACLDAAPPPAADAWSGAWQHDYGTLRLQPAPDSSSLLAALRESNAAGPALPCPSSSRVYTGEIVWTAIALRFEPFAAQVTACGDDRVLHAKYSNVPRLTSAAAARGGAIVGYFEAHLTDQNRRFQGSVRRWYPEGRSRLEGFGTGAWFGARR